MSTSSNRMSCSLSMVQSTLSGFKEMSVQKTCVSLSRGDGAGFSHRVTVSKLVTRIATYDKEL